MRWHGRNARKSFCHLLCHVPWYSLPSPPAITALHLLICYFEERLLCTPINFIAFPFAGESARAHATNSFVCVLRVGSLCLAISSPGMKCVAPRQKKQVKLLQQSHQAQSRQLHAQRFLRRTWATILSACALHLPLMAFCSSLLFAHLQERSASSRLVFEKVAADDS